MHPTRVVKRTLAVLALLVTPGLVLAEDDHILVALAAGSPPEPQSFKEQMLLTERIDARDRVFARLLLGGRVMVLAREGSRLSITEVSGAATIEVEMGRVAVTVDRENLHPEDLVEVRTPHAVATVPSDTLVVEVHEASAFTAVGRAVEVFRLDPVMGTVLDPPTIAAGDAVVTVEAPRRSVATR